MAKRATPRSPGFGKWLEKKRGKRSLEQIATQLRPHVKDAGFKMDQSALHKMERGRVPNWPVLFALSVVYKEPLANVVNRLTNAIEFPGRETHPVNAGTQNESKPSTVEAEEHPHVVPRTTLSSSVPLSDVVDAASILIDLGSQLHGIAATLLGRQVEAAGNDSSGRTHHSRNDSGPNAPEVGGK